MNTIFFVYLLTFSNGKIYVGMSRTDKKGLFTTRFRAHRKAAAKGQMRPVYNAWRKHGEPTQTVLSTHATRDECALAEINAIQHYDSMNPKCGYNLAPGGEGMHAPPGSAVYELMRAKVWNNPERRRKASEALKGKPLPEVVRAAQREWQNSAEGKALTSSITKRPEVRAKLSASMSERLTNGYGEYLSTVQVGKPKNRSEEGKARHEAAFRAWLDSEEGKAKTRASLAKARATPGAFEKLQTAAKVHAQSEANRVHCAQMSEKSRKPVKDLTSGQIYESRTAAAKACGVTGPTIGYWIKKGKFGFVEPQR